jgi:DNA invertase Pin-like site-specific DNA recombinase
MIDSGYSAYTGSNIAEGKLGEFLAKIRANKIPRGTYLLVEDHDRLSREYELDAFIQYAEIIRAGIKIVTLRDGRVHDKPDLGSLINSLVSMSRAHEESVRKSDLISKAWAKKRANAANEPLTARCPMWLELPPKVKGEKREYKKIPERVAVVKTIFELAAKKGFGNYLIAKHLNDNNIVPFGGGKTWGKSSVDSILRNRSVLGEYQPHKNVGKKRVPDGEPIPNCYPEIIKKDLFYRAQRIREQRLNHDHKPLGGRKGKFSNLFAGFAKECGYCFSPMYFENKGPGRQTYLVCSAAQSGNGCSDGMRWRYDDFEKSFARNFAYDIDWGNADQNQAKADHEAEILVLDGEIADIEKRLANLNDLYSRNPQPSTEQKIEQLEQQRSEKISIRADNVKQLETLPYQEQSFLDSQNKLKPLFKRLRDYNNRAEIAFRLKHLISKILVVTNGCEPISGSSLMTSNCMPRHHYDVKLPTCEQYIRQIEDEKGQPVTQFCFVELKNGMQFLSIPCLGHTVEIIPPHVKAKLPPHLKAKLAAATPAGRAPAAKLKA